MCDSEKKPLERKQPWKKYKIKYKTPYLILSHRSSQHLDKSLDVLMMLLQTSTKHRGFTSKKWDSTALLEKRINQVIRRRCGMPEDSD